MGDTPSMVAARIRERPPATVPVVHPNRPTAATDTAEAWRMWAVLAYQDTYVQTAHRRHDIARELSNRARWRRAS